MSWCCSLGSSGDSQVKIWDRSSTVVQLFHTLMAVFKELTLLLKGRDILGFSPPRIGWTMGGGVSRLLEFQGPKYSCQGCGATPGYSQAHNQGHSKECLTAQCNFAAQLKFVAQQYSYLIAWRNFTAIQGLRPPPQPSHQQAGLFVEPQGYNYLYHTSTELRYRGG